MTDKVWWQSDLNWRQEVVHKHIPIYLPIYRCRHKHNLPSSLVGEVAMYTLWMHFTIITTICQSSQTVICVDSTHLVKVLLQPLKFFCSFIETLLTWWHLVLQLRSFSLKRRLHLWQRFHLQTNCSTDQQLEVKKVKVKVGFFYSATYAAMPRPAALYNRRKWQLIGKSQWCCRAMLQLQHTPLPQSTAPGLHPVSIHPMAPPVQGSKHPITAYYSVYLPRKDERLSRPGWLVTYRNKVPPPGVEPGHVAHPSTTHGARPSPSNSSTASYGVVSPPGIAMWPEGLCFTDVNFFFKCPPCHSATGGRIEQLEGRPVERIYLHTDLDLLPRPFKI